MREARTIGASSTTGSESTRSGMRHTVLPIVAALSILAASTLVNILVAPSASAAATELYAWGYNVDGQLGNGTTTNAGTPVKVSLPAGVSATAAAAGEDHSLAIGSDGKLYAWGSNVDGQLGRGNTTSSSTPIVVSMPAGVTATAISAGEDHSVALGSDGNVYDWGFNGFGQLGNNTTTNELTPVKAMLPAGVTATAVAAGQYMTEALGSNGLVYTWGDGAMGELGNGSTSNEKTPVQVSTVTSVSAIAAGGYHSLVITAGTLDSFGYNDVGQLGNGDTTNQSKPVKVNLPAGVSATALAAGTYHSMAIGSNGKLYSWGNNGNGELGNGTTVNSSTPVVVSMPAGVTATAIADGADHSLAIGSDGNLYAWGYNGLDELGNGTTTDSSTPVQVGLTPVAKPPVAISSGSSADHSLRHRSTHARSHDDDAVDGALVGQLRPDGDDHRHNQPVRWRGDRQLPQRVEPHHRLRIGQPLTGRQHLGSAVLHVVRGGHLSPHGHLHRRHPLRHEHLPRVQPHGQHGPARRHRIVGVGHLRERPARHHALVLGVRERGQRRFSDHDSDLFDHRHGVELGGQLSHDMLGGL